MNTSKKEAYRNTAASVIKRLEARNMEGYYCDSSEEAIQLVKGLVPEGASIAWGGSETFSQTGIKDALISGNYQIIDRDTAKTAAEKKAIYLASAASDYFFMSSNAITFQGELVNIDGNGNRLACLIHGPEHVIILAGMNKLVPDVDSAIRHIQNTACPANAVRLHTNTPCEKTGLCANCQSEGCMCCEIVVTRRSRHNGRIKVILIGEPLGF